MQADKRRTPRRRTFLAGRVHLGQVSFGAVDCMVKSVSEDGARIAIAAPTLLSHSFLISIADAPARQARVVWYRDGQAGLSLEARFERRAIRRVSGSARRAEDGAMPNQAQGLAARHDPARDRLRDRIAAVTRRRTA